jgi:hypothetical protein
MSAVAAILRSLRKARPSCGAPCKRGNQCRKRATHGGLCAQHAGVVERMTPEQRAKFYLTHPVLGPLVRQALATSGRGLTDPGVEPEGEPTA